LIKNLSFFRKTKSMTKAAADLWDDLKEAVEEVKLHKQGKIKP
jgi:hypothetical protein